MRKQFLLTDVLSLTSPNNVTLFGFVYYPSSPSVFVEFKSRMED